MTSSSDTPKIGTERIQNIGFGFKHAAILMTAIELKLFTVISNGANALSSIASECGISLLNAERLVVACTALGLVEKKENHFYNAPDAEKYLVEGKPHYFGAWTMMGKGDFTNWTTLTDRITDTSPPSTLGFYKRVNPKQVELLTRSMFNVGLGSGSKLAKQFDFSNYKRVLDLGGGSGAYCVSLCRKFPGLEAVVFDFPEVCRITDELMESVDLSNRIKTIPGDFTNDPLPEGFDIMLMNGNIIQYGPEDAKAVIGKAFKTLLPGGAMHIIAENLNDEKTGPLLAATWSMHEALSGSKGRAHSNAEIRAYMEEAGFTRVEVEEFVHNVVDRVTGHKL